MNVAILYSGLINDFSAFYENHKIYIYQDYNIDFFISTYIYNDQSDLLIDRINTLLQPKNIDIEIYKNLESYFLNYKNEYIKKHTKDCRPINALSMFYKIKKSFNNILNMNIYDIIIRNRFDIKFNSKINLCKNNELNVPCGGDYRGGLMDLFAYGNPLIMNQYCNLFDFIPIYMKDDIYFHPESILRYHCQKQNIPINRFNFDIFLRGRNFTKSAPCYN